MSGSPQIMDQKLYLLHIFLHIANRFIDFLTTIELLARGAFTKRSLQKIREG